MSSPVVAALTVAGWLSFLVSLVAGWAAAITFCRRHSPTPQVGRPDVPTLLLPAAAMADVVGPAPLTAEEHAALRQLVGAFHLI